jgi:hypothetical protein
MRHGKVSQLLQDLSLGCHEQRGGPKLWCTTTFIAHSHAAASVVSKMNTKQHKIFCVHELIKTESATAVQRAFHSRFNIEPPMRKSICHWSYQFEQTGCLCKGNSSAPQCVSEESERQIQETSECSPRKSTHRASRELGIPQPSGVCWGTVYCLNHTNYS